jgi:hypothetical protein
VLEFDMLNARVDPFRGKPRLPSMGMRRDKRWNMVEVAVVFIVSENENRLFPGLGILSEDVERFGDVPRSVPGRIGMVRELFRRHEPTDRRKIDRFDIAAKLMKEVAFGDRGAGSLIMLARLQMS